jgi:hypothetical protein
MQAPHELPPAALLPEASGVDGPTQAALLLRRRKDARALDAELARTLSETAAGAALQDAKEASIQGRVAELAATEARWKPFIQETSSKEAKAVRRAQAEAAAAAQQAVEDLSGVLLRDKRFRSFAKETAGDTVSSLLCNLAAHNLLDGLLNFQSSMWEAALAGHGVGAASTSSAHAAASAREQPFTPSIALRCASLHTGAYRRAVLSSCCR